MPVYVDSNASGENNGTSWTDAFTSILSADGGGSTAGDEVWVASDHSEDVGSGTTTIDFSAATLTAPIKVISVNSGTDAYEAGAAITTSTGSIIFAGPCVYFFGLDVSTTGTLFLCGGSNSDFHRYEDCTLTSTGTGYYTYTSADSLVEIVNCTLDNFEYIYGARKIVLVRSCTFANVPANGYIANTTTQLVLATFEDCDMSAEADIVDTMGGANGQVIITLRRCKLHASYNLIRSGGAAAIGDSVTLENCAAGTISAAPRGITGRVDYRGTCVEDVTNFRSGGASDGDTPYSLKLVATTNTTEVFQPVCTREIPIWVEAGDSQTVTVYFAGASDRDDDELWIEVHSPNETDSPNTTAQGRFQSTRCDPNATPAALSRSASTTWDGAGTGIDGGTGQQYAQVTINPAVAGWCIVRACLANKASGATVYVDPFPVVA